MSEQAEYSLGVDLGQSPPVVAIARGDGVAMFTPRGDMPSHGVVEGDERAAVVQRLTTTIEQITEQEGAPPSAVVLALPKDRLAGTEDIAGEVARRLVLRHDRVRVIDEAEATALGSAQANAEASEEPGSVVAIGAARAGGRMLAAGAAGAVAGGLAAIAFGPGSTGAGPAIGPAGVPLPPPGAPVGPAGVPIAQGAASGPAGVPVGQAGAAGPVGTPFQSGVAASGPTGVPMNTTAGAGPAGVPIRGVRAFVRGHRGVVIAAVATVAVVAVAAIAVASGGNDSQTPTVAESVPSTAPAVTATTPPTDAATTVAAAVAPITVPITVPIAATTTSTVAAGPQGAAPRCAVGSWLADNRSLVDAIIGSSAALGGFPIENGDVTGAVHVDIGADGSLVTTFDNWLLTAAMPQGAGTATVSENGVESSTAVFGDDGSYSLSATQTNSTFTFSAAGTVLYSGQIPSGVFQGAGTYTCTGDQLTIVTAATVSTEIFSRSG